jgi:hypothetical protein
LPYTKYAKPIAPKSTENSNVVSVDMNFHRNGCIPGIPSLIDKAERQSLPDDE